MKRLLSIVLLCCMIVTSCSCAVINKNDRLELYNSAVAQLKTQEVYHDKTNVNDALLQAIYNEEFTEPKNVIYMIGDGMGFNSVAATEQIYKEQLYQNKLALNTLPVQSSQSTYSTVEVTDSAAGGTALATGTKTSNGTIAMNPDWTVSYKTLLELAAEKGMSTGLVATKSITDATPAAFSAHVQHRIFQEEIAQHQLQKFADGSLDLALGGGTAYYEAEENQEYLQSAKDAGLSYTTSWEDAKNANLPLAGLFASSELDTTQTPSIAEMTDFALNKLSADENGFFLMIEGSQIDIGSHSNDLDYMSYELYQFDIAVSIAMRYVALNPDTVLVITADHETGGLKLPENLSPDNVHKSYYTTSGHTGVNVPVFALGGGSEQLAGINDNTDIAKFAARCMGEVEFGSVNESKELIGELKVAFKVAEERMEVTDGAEKQIQNMIDAGSFASQTAIAFEQNMYQPKKELLSKELECKIDHLIFIDVQQDNPQAATANLEIYVPKGTKVCINGEPKTKTASTATYDSYSLLADIQRGEGLPMFTFTLEKDGIAYTFSRYVNIQYMAYSQLIDFADPNVQQAILDENEDLVQAGLIEFNGNTLKVTMSEDYPFLMIPANIFSADLKDFLGYQVLQVSISNVQKEPAELPLIELMNDRDSFTLFAESEEDLGAFERQTLIYPIPEIVYISKIKDITYLNFLYTQTEPATLEFSELAIAKQIVW